MGLAGPVGADENIDASGWLEIEILEGCEPLELQSRDRHALAPVRVNAWS